MYQSPHTNVPVYNIWETVDLTHLGLRDVRIVSVPHRNQFLIVEKMFMILTITLFLISIFCHGILAETTSLHLKHARRRRLEALAIYLLKITSKGL
jgi:hypothetical protein